MASLAALQTILAAILREKTLAIAFSGGLDSRFLAQVALQVAADRGRVRLLHLAGPHMAAAETARAEAWAATQGASFTLLAVNPLSVPLVRVNSPERCYHCKLVLFQTLLGQIRAEDSVLVDGSNATDAAGYRPGLRALAELGVRSPLMEAGLTKDDIHALAAEIGLSEPWQRARPCLLTRFPYSMTIVDSTLRQIESLEARAEQVLGNGPDSPDFRLRVMSDGGMMLQIESTDEAVAQAVRQVLPGVRVELVSRVSGFFDARRRGPMELLRE